MTNPGSLALAVVAAVTLIAAATDLYRFKVYNVLTFPSIIFGIIVSTVLGGLGGLGASLLGASVGFGVLVVFFALGGVGAGDVKLFTALGAWLGPVFTIQVFLASAVAAGLYALVLIVLQGGLTMAWINLATLWQRMLTPAQWSRPETQLNLEVNRTDRRRRLVPFAAMTFLGFIAVVIASRHELNSVVLSDDQTRPVATVTAYQSGGAR